MSKVPSQTLNAGQQIAADGFFSFLLGDEKELIISGPGGVGKTFLMGQMIDDIIPRYQHSCALMGIPVDYTSVVMTATTNKAAEVLSASTGRPAYTVHSLFNLRVQDNLSTGKSSLTKTRNWKVHTNKIIFIDEASMIDYALLTLIREGSEKCKIVYVGDHCQLSPIMEPISPIYRDKIPFYELTQPMRNSEQPELMALCSQLRQTVETGDFLPIQIHPGVVDHLSDTAMEHEVEQYFKKETESRILAYTNKRVVDYNSHIRELRQLSEPYTVGENLINNSSIQVADSMMRVEEEIQIISLEKELRDVEIEKDIYLSVQYADLGGRFGEVFVGMPLPADRGHFDELIKYYRKNKNWPLYFRLKNTFPDLRPRDAATVHKAQGSSYDTVFVDLGNLSTCRNPNQAARLLYVAFTRARSRIVLYGELSEKYGGLLF